MSLCRRDLRSDCALGCSRLFGSSCGLVDAVANYSALNDDMAFRRQKEKMLATIPANERDRTSRIDSDAFDDCHSAYRPADTAPWQANVVAFHNPKGARQKTKDESERSHGTNELKCAHHRFFFRTSVISTDILSPVTRTLP